MKFRDIFRPAGFIVTILCFLLATLVVEFIHQSTAEARRRGSVVEFANDFRTASTVTNAASGLQVLKNAEQDYSLKIISGDGSKNVTIIRFAGPSAEADIAVVYKLFSAQGEVLGLDW